MCDVSWFVLTFSQIMFWCRSRQCFWEGKTWVKTKPAIYSLRCWHKKVENFKELVASNVEEKKTRGLREVMHTACTVLSTSALLVSVRLTQLEQTTQDVDAVTLLVRTPICNLITTCRPKLQLCCVYRCRKFQIIYLTARNPFDHWPWYGTSK